MTNLDEIFKLLNNDSESPSDKVWEQINKDQNRKRTAWYLYFTTVLIVIGLGFYFMNDTKIENISIAQKHSELTVSTNNTIIPNKKKNDLYIDEKIHVNLKPNLYSNKSPGYITPSTEFSVSSQLIDQKQIIKTSKSVANTQISNSIPESVQSVTNPPSVATPILTPDIRESQPVVIVTNDSSNLNDSVRSISHQTFQPENRKKSEKADRKKYIQGKILMARNYRILSGAVTEEMILFKDRRNNAEISTLTSGLEINGGIELKKNNYVEMGLFYMPQKISSSYTWQLVKELKVIDSVWQKPYFDSTLMQWKSKSDTVSHFEKKSQNMISEGDQQFHYIRIPFIYKWEKEFYKFKYFIAGGLSVNLLFKSNGSIINPDQLNPGTLVLIQNASPRLISSDLLLRSGLFINPGNKYEFLIGLNGGCSISGNFNKNLLLKQNMYWYGVEAGIRKFVR